MLSIKAQRGANVLVISLRVACAGGVFLSPHAIPIQRSEGLFLPITQQTTQNVFLDQRELRKIIICSDSCHRMILILYSIIAI